jgi:hypothetical protein
MSPDRPWRARETLASVQHTGGLARDAAALMSNIEASVMATTVNSRSMRRTGFALYEINPKSGATVEIFYADIALARYFGARGAGWYWRY